LFLLFFGKRCKGEDTVVLSNPFVEVFCVGIVTREEGAKAFRRKREMIERHVAVMTTAGEVKPTVWEILVSLFDPMKHCTVRAYRVHATERVCRNWLFIWTPSCRAKGGAL
jgi:hypothetical protein